MWMASSDTFVIIDNGSAKCRAGLSTSSAPTCVFESVVGRPREVWKDSMESELYMGDDVNAVRDKLSLSNPFENSIIENMDEMELLWEQMYASLDVNPGNHNVILTERPYNPTKVREGMVEVMFEKFGVPSLNISVQGILALQANGFLTGLVLDSGEGMTNTIPVFEGYGLGHNIGRLDLGGQDLNTLLAKLLALQGHRLTTTRNQQELRKMKEKHCYVRADPDEDEEADEVQYKLPDGREISFADARWQCPEALFDPCFAGSAFSEKEGVADLVYNSIDNCDIDLRKPLFSNIVLAGGCTLFKGFKGRLKYELGMLVPQALQASGGINVIDTLSSTDAVWIGGQMVANIAGLHAGDLWMPYEDYEEYGASYIHERVHIKYS